MNLPGETITIGYDFNGDDDYTDHVDLGLSSSGTVAFRSVGIHTVGIEVTDGQGGVKLGSFQVTVEAKPTDFNEDGNVDVADVSLLTDVGNLVAGVAVPQADTKFDLTGDGIVDGADLDRWLADAATTNGYGSPYLRGDANIDGDVDIWAFDNSGDAQLLSENLGMGTGAVWGNGDFNGDGDVDVWAMDSLGDAQLLCTNLGSSLDVGTNAVPEPSTFVILSTNAVPEPSTFVILSMGALGLLAYGWRQRRFSGKD